MTRKVRVTVAAAAVAAAFAAPTAASAQSLYTGTPVPRAGAVDSSAPAGPARFAVSGVRTQSSSGLALTGSDVAGLGLVGLGAIATGTVLVRRGRRAG